MTRASPIFLRARLVLVAELDALNVTSDLKLPQWALAVLPRWTSIPLDVASSALRTSGYGTSVFGAVGAGGAGGGGSESDTDEVAAFENRAQDWVGRVLHMETTTEAIVDRRITSAVGTMMDALSAHEAKLLEVERRLTRKLAQAEKLRAEAARKADADAQHEKMFEPHKRMELERTTNARFESIVRAQRESEQRLLQAIKAAK
jgi:hypothetical protein